MIFPKATRSRMFLNNILTHKKDIFVRLLYNTLFSFGKECFFLLY